jgi:predicted methyltransferase
VITRVRHTQRAARLLALFVVIAILFVTDQAVRTLRTLDAVEHERDAWQRPDDVLAQLDLRSGATVVDVGSGAGYFALKMAPRVAPDGRVVAVDLRRQSLAFLWLRAVLSGQRNLHVMRGDVADPALPLGDVDAALIANTYHELVTPAAALAAIFTAMRPGARLVVVDRGPRHDDVSTSSSAEHHDIPAAVVAREISRLGFEIISRDDRFIDRPADSELWWLLVFRRP